MWKSIISTFSTLGVSRIMRYINPRYLLTVFLFYWRFLMNFTSHCEWMHVSGLLHCCSDAIDHCRCSCWYRVRRYVTTMSIRAGWHAAVSCSSSSPVLCQYVLLGMLGFLPVLHHRLTSWSSFGSDLLSVITEVWTWMDSMCDVFGHLQYKVPSSIFKFLSS